MRKDNIVLIGMPASGKSVIGVVLAKYLNCGFIDSDILIQEETAKPLSELIREHGLQGFLDIEGRINASIEPKRRMVISTGGSVIYRDFAMEHLRSIGKIVYLKVEFAELCRRLHDLETRGVAIADGMTFEDLYAERVPLYEKYADVTIDEADKHQRQIVEELVRLFK